MLARLPYRFHTWLLTCVCLSLVFWFMLKAHSDKLSAGHDLLQDVSNSTLGFQKIFVVGLASRTDRRDSMTLAAAYSGLDIEYVDGVTAISDKATPPGWATTKQKNGTLYAWRSHMNVLSKIVEQNLTSALVLEDDVDWDIRIKSQMTDFAKAARLLIQPLPRTNDEYLDPTYPKPRVRNEGHMDFRLDEQHVVSEPTQSAFGDLHRWDLLWLGHCGARFPRATDENTPLGRVVMADNTVPEPQHLDMEFGNDELTSEYPAHTRVVSRARVNTCSLAYGVSQAGARRFLYELGVQGTVGPFDLMLQDVCDGNDARQVATCLSVQPQLFQHHRPVGSRAGFSDIDNYDDGYNDHATTSNIRLSVLNLGYGSPKTPAIGATLQCEPVNSDVLHFDPTAGLRGVFTVSVPITIPDAPTANCTGQIPDWGTPARKQYGLGPGKIQYVQTPDPSEGQDALELGVVLGNDTICGQRFLMGWLRATFEEWSPWMDTGETGPTEYGEMPETKHARIKSMNSTLIRCSPKFERASALITVQADGRVVQSTENNRYQLTHTALSYQANRFLVDTGMRWHNDSSSSDFTNYLLAEANRSIPFLTASEPPPTFEEAVYNVDRLYQKMFALLVANNLPYFFEPSSDDSETTAASFTLVETRIFISLSAFIVSIAILCPYVLVTCWLYLRRPWDVLPRLPKSMASMIAYFAASNAVAQMSLPENREKFFDREEWRWGYGSFVGPDGKRHVGLECEKWLNDGEVIELLDIHGGSLDESGLQEQ
ncbi:hypothetical protein Q7P37_011075 [Cladosporium fusiforme]